jgi:hypothetical protein
MAVSPTPRKPAAKARRLPTLPTGAAFHESDPADYPHFRVVHEGVGQFRRDNIVNGRQFGPGTELQRLVDLGAVQQLTPQEEEQLADNMADDADDADEDADPSLRLAEPDPHATRAPGTTAVVPQATPEQVVKDVIPKATGAGPSLTGVAPALAGTTTGAAGPQPPAAKPKAAPADATAAGGAEPPPAR